jgi:hypothetical protein
MEEETSLEDLKCSQLFYKYNDSVLRGLDFQIGRRTPQSRWASSGMISMRKSVGKSRRPNRNP